MNYSHLRYPGGKSKIVPLIRLIIENDKKQNMTYMGVEEFLHGDGEHGKTGGAVTKKIMNLPVK